jgi:hypothetical protein
MIYAEEGGRPKEVEKISSAMASSFAKLLASQA